MASSEEKREYLSEVDMEALVSSPTSIKIDIIKKIGKYYTAGSFSDAQRKEAGKILGVLLTQSETKIRQAISESIKNADGIPNDIVMHLAQDIAIVAVPVLEFSNSLTDDNLIYIIQATDDVEKQESISRRETVSENVSEALIEKGHQSVVVTLLRNKGASVSNLSYEKIIKEFPDVKIILEVIVERPKVPIEIVRDASQKLIPSNSNEIINEGTENVKGLDAEFDAFVEKVEKNHIEKDIVPIYALCNGSIRLFQKCVAIELCLPVMNVKKLIDVDNNGENFDILYERAKLPGHLQGASKVLYLVLKDFYEGVGIEDVRIVQNDSQRVINNMLMLSEEMGEVEYVEYLAYLIKGGIEK